MPEDGALVPKHAGVMKDCIIVYTVCESCWFSKRKKVAFVPRIQALKGYRGDEGKASILNSE